MGDKTINETTLKNKEQIKEDTNSEYIMREEFKELMTELKRKKDL